MSEIANIRKAYAHICVLCQQPRHPCISCHEARFRRGQTVEVDTPRFSFREPSPPPYYDDYYETVEDEYNYYYTDLERDDEYLEPENDDVRCPCCGYSHKYDDGVCEVFLENPTYWSAKIKAAVSASRYGGELGSKYFSETEGDDEYKTLEDKKLAELKEILSELEEYLLSPDLSREVRIRYLTQKSKVLKWKIYLEEDLSPLPDNIKDFYFTKEEIVEENTTSKSSSIEVESLETPEVTEEVAVKQSDKDKRYPKSDPLLEFIMLLIKCGEEEEGRILVKATGRDFSVQISISFKRLNLLYIPPLLKQLPRRYVKYRAYLGNVKGKCALRPP